MASVTKEEKAVELLYTDLEKIQKQLLKKLDTALKSGLMSDVEIAQLYSELNLFEELNKLGYTSKLDAFFKIYEDIIKQINDQAKARGLRGLVGLPVSELDNFVNLKAKELLGQAQLYADKLKSGIMGHLISGTPLKDIIGTLQSEYEVPLKDYQLKVALNTGVKQFRTLTTAKVYEEKPETKYTLYGPIDEKNRPTCKGVLEYQPKEGFTKKEIDEGAWLKLAKRGAVEFGVNKKGEPIPSAQVVTDYTFLECGGFNCRHEPIAIYKD